MFKGVYPFYLVVSALAKQDTAYYNGFSNPNANINKYYYRESVNVLQDLMAGEFSALYIKYHGCVWSEYGMNGDGKGDVGCLDYEANDAGADDDAEGNSAWYLQASQCYRPNVAYSLYGVKEGEVFRGCNSVHYINSFFTSYGIEAFGDAASVVGFDLDNYGDYARTGCDVDGDDDYQYGYQYQYQDQNGDDYNYDGRNYNYKRYTSHGLACSADGSFIRALFQGGYCTGDYFLRQTNASEYLETLNEDLNSLGCIRVYNEDDNQYAGENLQNAPAWNLLKESVSCSVNEYPDRCPDPFGSKRKHDAILRDYSLANQYAHKTHLVHIFTILLFIIGAIELIQACRVRGMIVKTAAGEDQDPLPLVKEVSALATKHLPPKLVTSASNISQRTVDSFVAAKAAAAAGAVAATAVVAAGFVATKKYAEEKVEQAVAYAEEEEEIILNDSDSEESYEYLMMLDVDNINKEDAPPKTVAPADASPGISDSNAAVSAKSEPKSSEAKDEVPAIDDNDDAVLIDPTEGEIPAVDTNSDNSDDVVLIGTTNEDSNAEVANAILAEKGIPPNNTTEHDNSNVEVANAMLAEKGMPPRNPTEHDISEFIEVGTTDGHSDDDKNEFIEIGTTDGNSSVVLVSTAATRDSNADVANAILAVKGITRNKKKQKKFKRPRLAKVSRLFTSSRRKKGNTANSI